MWREGGEEEGEEEGTEGGRTIIFSYTLLHNHKTLKATVLVRQSCLLLTSRNNVVRRLPGQHAHTHTHKHTHTHTQHTHTHPLIVHTHALTDALHVPFTLTYNSHANTHTQKHPNTYEVSCSLTLPSTTLLSQQVPGSRM